MSSERAFGSVSGGGTVKNELEPSALIAASTAAPPAAAGDEKPRVAAEFRAPREGKGEEEAEEAEAEAEEEAEAEAEE